MSAPKTERGIADRPPKQQARIVAETRSVAEVKLDFDFNRSGKHRSLERGSVRVVGSNAACRKNTG